MTTPSTDTATSAERAASVPTAEPPSDPRLEAVGAIVSEGDWKGVLESLGSSQAAPSLPASLALLHAVAQKEAQVPISEADRDRADPTQTAIRAMASLLGVPETSPVALVLAKRLLRSNPVSWRERKAPPVFTSIGIVLVGLLFGLAVGYVISVGYVQIRLPALG